MAGVFNPGVSGLERIPQSDQLHQPHQVRMVDAPGDRITRRFDFQNAAFGRNNKILLESQPMVVEDLILEVTTTHQAGSTTSKYGVDYLVQAQSWFGDNGCVLTKNTLEVYQATEPELRLCDKFFTDSFEEQYVYNDMCDETTNASLETRWETPVNPATKTRTVRIHLRPIAEKVMANFGSIGAYAANTWRLAVDLKPLNRITSTKGKTISGNLEVTGYTGIESMTLIMTGHREDSVNQDRVTQALAGSGIKIVFDAPFATQVSLPANPSGVPILYKFPQVEGLLTQIWLLPRYATGLTSTTAATVDVSDWLTRVDIDKLGLAFGPEGMPFAVFGQYLPYSTVLTSARGYQGAGTQFIKNAPAWDLTTPWADTNPSKDVTNTKAIQLSFAEKASMAGRFGMWSGAIRINNNFQAAFNYASTTLSAATTVDVILWIRRVAVVKHNSVEIVNEI